MIVRKVTEKNTHKIDGQTQRNKFMKKRHLVDLEVTHNVGTYLAVVAEQTLQTF